MDEHMRKKLGVDENKPVAWFENLYAEANEQGQGVPWANMATHPVFKSWIDKHLNIGIGKTALVVGCGLGDDAIELENNGFEVTAFDVSNSAIELCKKRFPNSKTNFIQADLLEGVPEWYRKFDFVLEIFTIQALPPKYENVLINNIADFVAPTGQLLMITEVQQEKRSFEKGPPWLLNENYKKSFENHGLKLIEHSNSFEPQMGDALHLSLFELEG